MMNSNFFNEITSNNIAYWIGFITADGSVNKNSLSIGLALKDKEHLEKFLKAIQATTPIRERQSYCQLNDKYYPSCDFSINNI